MCGICGKIYLEPSRPVDQGLIIRMRGKLCRRGPDAMGILFKKNLGLGVRILHIRDRINAQQPFANETQTIHSVFNGEIYNYSALKQDLISKGHRFFGDCDAQIFPHLFEEYGDEFVRELNGMFALAVADVVRGRFLLARDRMGVKPLYYSLSGEGLSFSSSLSSLLEDTQIPRDLDPEGLDAYLSYNYFPSDLTPFKNIKKLLPGQILSINGKSLALRNYWKFNFSRNRIKSESEYVQEFKDIFQAVVKDQLVGVPEKGVFVSGGLDSSILCAYASRYDNSVKTFNVGFRENSFDERNNARSLTRFLKTRHYECVLPEDLESEMEKVALSLDIPVGEGSYLPLFFLSEFARKHAGIVLSGEGADELFGGYRTYTADIMAKYGLCWPKFWRANIFPKVAKIFPRSYHWMNLRFAWELFSRGIADQNRIPHYSWREVFNDSEKELLYAPDYLTSLKSRDISEKPYALFQDKIKESASANFLDQAMYFDTVSCLPEGMLQRVDMASMHHSLEVRVPFLDNRVVDFSLRLPLSMKIRGFSGKIILKKSSRQELPRKVLNRAKHGFSAPVSKWLREDLRGMLREQLPGKINICGNIFNPIYLESLMAKHFSGEIDAGRKLWNLFILSHWFKRRKDRNCCEENRSGICNSIL